MDKYLKSYIDSNIIREYAYRSKDGYYLDVSDVPSPEQENLLDLVFNKDPIIKELILDRLQDLINERIPYVECADNYAKGLKPSHDQNTGEVKWVPQNYSLEV